ncbi:MAG: hypothetical protein UT90_C0014G0026 [Parcubacteria group bacterium GW2011_GWA1_40_21]|nr:MAG: hypothetical protein UT90_C0014G0026 [Parcubacteria group bacterium GW2011_GWA1_40_21]
MIIRIVDDSISLDELREIAKEYYIDMIKGVADISKEIIAVGGEYHMDANMKILENGSIQSDVWGFNILLDRPRDERIEFTSLINIRSISARWRGTDQWKLRMKKFARK